MVITHSRAQTLMVFQALGNTLMGVFCKKIPLLFYLLIG